MAYEIAQVEIATERDHAMRVMETRRRADPVIRPILAVTANFLKHR